MASAHFFAKAISAGLLILSAAVAAANTPQQDGGPILRPRKSNVKSAPSMLLLTCDLACNWKLDGVEKGRIDAGDSAAAKVVLGQHVITVSTDDNADKMQQIVTARANEQTVVNAELKPVRDARLKADQQARDEVEREAREEAAQEAREKAQQVAQAKTEQDSRDRAELAELTWTDQATGLIWTRKDSKTILSWQDALDYCRGLNILGHADWRVPTIDELQGLYDPRVSIQCQCCEGENLTWHVKGNLRLCGYYWSTSPGNASDEAWIFLFDIGKRSLARTHSYYFSMHALCVRRLWE